MKIINLPSKIITFFKEVKMEMKKVNWPTAKETVRYTLIIVGSSIAIAVFLGGLDLLLNKLLYKFIINRFSL
jgi:preprotein translocase subunit SecE